MWTKPAPASGLIASGRAETLDAVDWIALTRGGEGGGGKLPLQRIDVTAQRLQLLGGTFPDTRVIVAPAARGAIAIQAEGAALQGAVLVPAGEGEAMAGRMQRVHWRPAKVATAAPADTSATTATTRNDEIDPAKIPALTIDIDELQLGDARLGTAKVRTRSTATGMRIEQLQTRAPKQHIDLSGDWNGKGAMASTRLKVEIGSEDFGALLTGFGMGGRLAAATARSSSTRAGRAVRWRSSSTTSKAACSWMRAMAACWKSNPARAACWACSASRSCRGA